MENFAGTPSSETLPLARAYAERALTIDDQLPEAHSSLAFTFHRSWNWAEAEKEYRRTIELNPNYAPVHQLYSLYLRETGRLEESLAPGLTDAEAVTIETVGELIGLDTDKSIFEYFRRHYS
ncbi:MAG: tetratricopeptide repeat protein, partial [Pyrinomonadaceae bacterium]